MIMMRKNKKEKHKNYSQLGLIIFRFKKNKLAVFSVFCLGLIALAILTAPLYIDYDKAIVQDISIRFQGPSWEHPFGTDLYGRDLLARVIYGGRISLFAGLFIILFSFLIGVIIGSIAGFFGGKVDQVLMRFVDIFMAVPTIFLAMTIVTALGEGVVNIVIAFVICNIPSYSRIVRSSTMTLRNMEYVEAAKCYGASNLRIILKHIIPNGIGPVIVTATISLGVAILSISSLGFLGLGISPPTPEWGTLLSDNRFYIRYYPYLGILPGIAIILTVMCVNFIGDGLRDALDPKMKK
ncbi:ABC transporter permease [Clostridium sp. Marseille-P3244]|uniref:ABC transporter permease n=1 Tax=Clostridium sp. Marseille-P3244 TaxID=1871020 RepID=UPI000A5FB6D6|nr:ABC transporter permease [Clostridium sp. Marseille-P3244]